MNANDIVLLALKHKVTAIAKSDGRHLWCTEIRGGLVSGGDFITLASDDTHVFAYSGGHLHCLELFSGRLLWSDELPGYGFGLASLCLPGHGSAPDHAAVKQLMAQRNVAVTSAAAAT
jgi:outer membrane protein assembly factor BamB